MKMPDLTLFDGFDGLGLGEGFMWDGAAGRDVPSLLRWLVETGSLTISPPESVAIEQHAAEEISIEGSDAAEPSAAALIGLVISKMQAVAEASGLSWSYDGPAAHAMWPLVIGNAIYFQLDLDGDSRPDRIFSIDTRTMTLRTVLDRLSATEKAVVSSITFGANDGALALGEAVTVVVEFSAPVTVTGGTPALLLSNGGVAAYVAGAGTNRLVFSYVPGAGEDTADLGIAGLASNGARLVSLSGLPADLSGLSAC